MKKSVSFTKLIAAVIFVLLYIFYIFLYENISGTKSDIYILSLCGSLELLYCFFTLKKVTGRVFSLYGIFILFAFLFNYGQCLMWSIGVHYGEEIGTANLFTKSIPSLRVVAQTQLITLLGLLAFHTGALFVMKQEYKLIDDKISMDLYKKNIDARALYIASILTFCISMPLMYIYEIRDIIVNNNFGYGATLYNESVVASQNNIIELLRQMFFPSIVGILISTGYKKRSVRICYACFFLYVILNLMGGHRGAWIYPLIILIWMYNRFVKKIRIKQILMISVIGYFIILVAVCIRNIRDIGISGTAFLEALFIEDNPIVSAIFLKNLEAETTILLISSLFFSDRGLYNVD